MSIQNEIPYKHITEQAFNDALEIPEMKTKVMMLKLTKGDKTHYVYIQTKKIEIAERILLKTYLSDLYTSAWDDIQFLGYDNRLF